MTRRFDHAPSAAEMEAIARAALDGLPEPFATHLRHVVLQIDEFADEELLARLMGPTGNLRAPTARVGTTLVVGFNKEAYRQVLAADPRHRTRVNTGPPVWCSSPSVPSGNISNV